MQLLLHFLKAGMFDCMFQIDEKLRSRGAGNYTSLGWREKNGVVFSADVKNKSCVTNGTSSALGIK